MCIVLCRLCFACNMPWIRFGALCNWLPNNHIQSFVVTVYSSQPSKGILVEPFHSEYHS